MRFYEFCDLPIDEDLEKALDAKSKSLDNQKTSLDNRTKILAIQKAQKANRDAVKKMANHLKSK